MITPAGHWTKIARARISRRRALAWGAVCAGAGAATAIAGCGGGPKKPAAGAPRRGGRLRIGTTLPLASGLDPQIENGTGLAIFPRVYGYPLHVDPRDESVIYDHAVSVEQPDATTYILKMRPDIKFQDIPPVNGRVVAANDVVRSIERYRANPLVSSKVWHSAVLDRIEAPDATTVRVTTTRPYAYSLQELGGISAGAIIPKELVDAEADLQAQGVGSGPFRIDQVTAGESVRLARNDAYYRSPAPYLDAMEWRLYGDDDAKLADFRARSIDVAPNHDRDEAQGLRDVPGVEIDAQPSLAWLSLGLRCDRPPFNDPRVRGALDLALNRDALIRDIGFGEGDVLGPVNPHLADGYWSLSQEDVLAASDGATPVEERRAAAGALLAAADADRTSFKLQVAALPQLIDVATVVRQQLITLGISIDLQELDLVVWYTNFHRGEFDATLISHVPYESPDVPARLYHSAGPDGAGSPFGFGDAAIDALVERSWGEQDRGVRRATLLEAQRLMLGARPMLQLFTSSGYTSAWSYVRDRRAGLPGSLAQYNYEQWLSDP